MKLKKGDNVKVLSGNYKGMTGEVLEVLSKADKVIVKGVNIRTKATKPKKAGDEGGLIKSEYPVHSSIVAVVCPKCGKAVRVGYKVVDGKKTRVCKNCGEELK